MKKIVLLLLCLGLNACATRHQFDCPYKEGARCLSVDEIDKKIDKGEIGNQSDNKKHAHSTINRIDEKLDAIVPSSLRTPETVLTLWVAPFYSEDGIYHEAHRLHFVAKESAWKGVNAEVKEEAL